MGIAWSASAQILLALSLYLVLFTGCNICKTRHSLTADQTFTDCCDAPSAGLLILTAHALHVVVSSELPIRPVTPCC